MEYKLPYFLQKKRRIDEEFLFIWWGGRIGFYFLLFVRVNLRKNCLRVTKFKSLRKNYRDPICLFVCCCCCHIYPYEIKLSTNNLTKQCYCLFSIRRHGPNFSLGGDNMNILLVTCKDVRLGNLIKVFKSNLCLIVWYIPQSAMKHTLIYPDGAFEQLFVFWSSPEENFRAQREWLRVKLKDCF